MCKDSWLKEDISNVEVFRADFTTLKGIALHVLMGFLSVLKISFPVRSFV